MTILTQLGYDMSWVGDFIVKGLAMDTKLLYADYEKRGGGWYRYKDQLYRGRNALRDAVWADR